MAENPPLINKNSSGFTLIEILVVIGIIALLSGVVLANYRSNQGQLALKRSAQKLAQDLRRAEEMAMSAKEFQGSVPPGGYGIYFDTTEPHHYILFADFDPENGDYDDPSEQVVDISLESKIEIKNLSSSDDSLTVIFIPPDPQVSVSGGAPAKIELCLEMDTSQTRTVKVYQSGLISTP